MSQCLRHLGLAALLATAAFAQSNNRASLGGVVRDPSEAVVSGAAVSVTNPQTGLVRQTTSDNTGFYRFELLPPGDYDLTVEAQGFQKFAARGIPLQVGALANQDVKLTIGGSTSLDVVAEAPPMETTRAQQANVIEQRAITELPIDRRDYLTFSLLAPGVSDSKALADSNSFRVKQTPDSGLSFYGSNGRGNSVNVDGGESNDGGGGVRPTVSQEAVREFQINRSNYTAEYGGSRGGVVNIVTKSGGNETHGSGFGFFRHQSLDATNPFSQILNTTTNTVTRLKPGATRQQIGGTVGGALRRNRTFYFTGYEQLRRRENNAVPILTDTSVFGPTPAQRAILSQLPSAAAAQLTAVLSTPASVQEMFRLNSGIFPFQTDQHQGLLRLDHQPNDANQFTFRFNTSKLFDTNPNVSALTGNSRGFVQDTFDATGFLGWFHTFSPRVVNEARAQFNYYNQLTGTNDPFGPALEIAGFGNFNRDRFLPSDVIARRSELADNLTISTGRHTIKTGVYALIRNQHSDSKTFFSGRFTFGALPGGLVNPALASTTINALQAFNLGLAQSYQQGFGDGVVKATYPLIGGYAQDEWRATSQLTFNAGLRYEVDNRRAPLPTSKRNIAPRFGFAWSPDTKTVVRGGYGLYYATIDFQIDYTVQALGINDSGYRQIAQVLSTIQTPGAQSANNIFSTLRNQGIIGIPTPKQSIVPANLTQFGINISQTGPLPPLTVLFSPAKDYRNPLTQQASFGIQREMAGNVNISSSFIWVRGTRLTNSYDQNVLSSAPFDPAIGTQNYGPTAARPAGYFVNPLIFQSNVYESNANSSYAGLILEGTKRFSRGASLNGNWTWSHAIDETTDFNSDFQPNNQACRRCERASSSFDTRHKVVIYAMLQSPSNRSRLLKDWIFSPIYQFRAGQPFNLLTGAELNNDRHNTTDRPAYAGRNTGLGPSFQTFSMRLIRAIPFGEKRRLDLMFETFNLFNKLNYQSVNNTVGINFNGPFNVTGRHDRRPGDPLGFTSAAEPRRIQLGFRVTF